LHAILDEAAAAIVLSQENDQLILDKGYFLIHPL
jgi:hypothetical protein